MGASPNLLPLRFGFPPKSYLKLVFEANRSACPGSPKQRFSCYNNDVPSLG
jgi:hypothetical protein